VSEFVPAGKRALERVFEVMRAFAWQELGRPSPPAACVWLWDLGASRPRAVSVATPACQPQNVQGSWGLLLRC